MYEENNNQNKNQGTNQSGAQNYQSNYNYNSSQYNTGNNSGYVPNSNGPQEYYYTTGTPNNANQNYTTNANASRKKAKKPKNSTGFARRIALCVALGLVFGLTAGAAFSIPTYLSNREAAKLAANNTTSSTTSQAPVLDTTTSGIASATTTSQATASDSDISTIAANCLPSVVSITNKGVSEVQTMFGNFEQEYEASGSGIIIGENDTELLIVTNNHVVTGSSELSVIFSYDEDSEEPTVVEAKLKGYDSDKDLAVIAVSLDDLSDDQLSNIKIATIGDSSSLQLGENVVAIGNALGYGQSVTTGIVSALNREVSVQAEDGSTITNKLIQTDAAINPGNSGGALLNMKGELIGINSVKVATSEVEGMGYAIPISDVQDIINELMVKETRDTVSEEDQGYIGIAGTDVTSQISTTYDLPMGIYVSTVYENSPAANAGIQKGYIITKFDGTTVKTMSELKELLSYYKAGETAPVIVEVQGANGYEEQTLSITLGTKEAIEQNNKGTDSSNSSNTQEEQPEEQTEEQSQNNYGSFPFSPFFGN